MTLFSVIIPTRDRPQFLRQAVASVLAQRHDALELLLVDDGSGIDPALATLDGRIRLVDNRRRGPVAARTLGVTEAKGEHIAFLDDDDWWTDCGFLAKADAAFRRGAVFCFGDGVMMHDDGTPPLPFAFDADRASLERDNTILVSAVTYRRDLHAALGPFDATLPFYWDWDWYLRVARAGHALTRLAEPVVAIRVHAQNMSGKSLQALRRANLDAFSRKHRLPPIALKNHLDIATQSDGTPASLQGSSATI